MSRVLLYGFALTGLVVLLEWAIWGRQAVVAAATFGSLATVIQAGAVWKLKPALNASFREMIRGWAVGSGLRLAGVVLMVVAVVANRELFPPLPTAVGYLAVVIPLLFGEIHLSK